jgi:Ca2+-binding EF-hand superfamily protein
MTRVSADPVDAKIEAEFDKLDLNHDGNIEWSDYETLIDRYKRAAHVGEDDRRITALRAFYQIHWLELLRYAEAKGDRLSKGDFVAATRAATTDTSRFNVSEVGAHVIFDLIDHDSDGRIKKDELVHFLENVWQITESEALYELHTLDAKGDSVISRDEFVGGIHEHLDTPRRSADSG